jgi:riboflavin kinase
MSNPTISTTEKDWSHLYEKEEKTFESPVILEAEVVHGFKRGSKDLGIPTANLNMDELGDLGNNLDTGIYYGWAILPSGTYQTVVSVGWNPFYKNIKKTVEAHLLLPLDDFYGDRIKLVLPGYLRNELNFSSLGIKSSLFAYHFVIIFIMSISDDLISCIHADIALTKLRLDSKDVPLV